MIRYDVRADIENDEELRRLYHTNAMFHACVCQGLGWPEIRKRWPRVTVHSSKRLSGARDFARQQRSSSTRNIENPTKTFSRFGRTLHERNKTCTAVFTTSVRPRRRPSASFGPP